MSISNTLLIETQMTPFEVREMLISNDLGLMAAPYDRLRGEGVHVGIGTENQFGQDVTFDEHGFRPSLHIIFDLDSDEDEEEGKRITGRATAALLRKDPGEAVLLFNGEKPILKKCDGRIIVRNGWGEDWLKPALNEINMEYEVSDFVPTGF